MTRGRGGFTLVELIAGLGIVAVLVWVLVPMLRVGLASATRSSGQAALLGEARRAFGGEGAYKGLVLQAQEGLAVTTMSAAGLYVQAADLSVTSYTVTAGNLRTAKAGTVKHRARGIQNLSLAYYGLTADYRIAAATSPATARLVTFSFEAPRKDRTVKFFTGARLRNRR